MLSALHEYPNKIRKDNYTDCHAPLKPKMDYQLKCVFYNELTCTTSDKINTTSTVSEMGKHSLGSTSLLSLSRKHGCKNVVIFLDFLPKRNLILLNVT